MSACTFFGHRNCSKEIEPPLRAVLVDLIENCDVDTFYVGNQGNFDYTVQKVLRELKKIYPHITYQIVLAYMPKKHSEFDTTDYSDTMIPDGLENIPRKFAISWRNKWMIDKSDFVVTYVTHSFGGAAQFAELAEKKRRRIIPVL